MLDEIKLIQEQREKEYGNTEESFQRIAVFWSNYLRIPITTENVAMMMSLLKISRTVTDKKFDSYLDAASYIVFAEQFKPTEPASADEDYEIHPTEEDIDLATNHSDEITKEEIESAIEYAKEFNEVNNVASEDELTYKEVLAARVDSIKDIG